ncbi:MAG: hypothetical protein KDC90_10820 [Ignavibacteriae bacterium]|nr:hypothetical protein [Ignavibacteriota bacterium]
MTLIECLLKNKETLDFEGREEIDVCCEPIYCFEDLYRFKSLRSLRVYGTEFNSIADICELDLQILNIESTNVKTLRGMSIQKNL